MRIGSGEGPLPIPGLGLQSGVDREEIALNGAAESCHRGDAQDGDQADEHAVLDESRALIVLHETSNQVTHIKIPS